MCHYLSFMVSVKKNQIDLGDGFQHATCSHSSSEGDWREAEWTGPTQGDLVVRVADGEDDSAYKATVLARYKTRAKMEAALMQPCEYKGSKSYWKNGELHRDGDKPAVIWANGGKEYYKNGRFIK